MTRNETISVLKILKVNYQNFCKDTTRAEMEDIISLWQDVIQEPIEIVKMAIKSIITTNKFPPTIADVKEKIDLLQESPEAKRTEIEAWNQVYKAIKNSNYEANFYFELFDDDLKRLVGSPNQLRQWAKMDIHQINTVVQSNFMRSYRSLTQKSKEYRMLPQESREMIQGQQRLLD